nr:asparagine synthase C-terminal domain-containing protein [Myxococcus fulvus]
MPHQSLFKGVGRVDPPLPRVHRIHLRRDDDERATREGPPRFTTHREAHRQDDGQARAHRTAHQQEDGPAPPVAHGDDELAGTLLSACSDAVAVRLREGARDVSLSGGVDSAVLCMLAARLAPGQVRAWSMDVHFADETERRNARTVARLAGVEHVDVPIPDAVLPELFEQAVLATESPILNARAIASFAFYAEARRHGASVMLSGAGADEVLMGNPSALAAAMARIEEDRRLVQTVLRASVDNLRMGNPRASAPGAASVAEDRRLVRTSVDKSQMSSLRAAPPGGEEEHRRPRTDDESQKDSPRVFSPSPARAEEDGRHTGTRRRGAVDNLGTAPWSVTETSASEEVRYAAWVLRELVLPPELRGAQAHGITVHTPYLDTRCADVALALPESSLRREGVGKWLFRHAVRGLVPEEVRLARKTPRYGHTALSSPVRTRWLELYREWLSPAHMESLGVILPGAPLSLLERYIRLDPDAPEASVVDRLLMRLCSLAMLHAHAVRLRPCPES